MQPYRKLFWTMLVILLLLSTNSLAADKEKPSGTLVIDEVQMMLLVGGDLGGGTLLLGDKSYSFKTGGLKLGGMGIHKLHLVGDVYHLTNVKDFAGVYFAAEAGITIIKGKSGLWLKNSKGVTLHLKASAEGAALNLGVEGFKITME